MQPPPVAALQAVSFASFRSPVNDDADMTVGTTAQPALSRQARVLAVVSIALGAVSCVAAWRMGMWRELPTTFPWFTLAAAVGGTLTALMSLLQRARGRITTMLALLGLLTSLAFPLLIVFVFVRYLNVNS